LAERKSFLVRIDGQVLEALRRWAADDLRSLNGQMEFVLRRALWERGRLAAPADSSHTIPDPDDKAPEGSAPIDDTLQP
jgi:hypothetical protein